MKCRINPVRIETEGYGSNYPFNKNNTTEEQRQANRRVEVTITEINELYLDGLTKKDK